MSKDKFRQHPNMDHKWSVGLNSTSHAPSPTDQMDITNWTTTSSTGSGLDDCGPDEYMFIFYAYYYGLMSIVSMIGVVGNTAVIRSVASFSYGLFRFQSELKVFVVVGLTVQFADKPTRYQSSRGPLNSPIAIFLNHGKTILAVRYATFSIIAVDCTKIYIGILNLNKLTLLCRSLG